MIGEIHSAHTFSIHFDEIRNNHKPPCQSNIINIKGGEKGLTCEWDRLMELPKEELVIELVRSRYRFDSFVSTIIEHAKDPHCISIESGLGYVPTEEWLNRIIDYAKKEEPDYDELDLILYGVDADYVTDLIMKED